ncbi:MAG: 16S rRNA (cytidine(1402)-2'-O)-methyltransferase [Micropepsaceae bacterium]
MGGKTSGGGQRRQSDQALSPGLYLVATPIGNASDITLRALHVLKNADAVFAEDTRVTAKLLALHALNRPLHSYREHNADRAEIEIIRELEKGHAVALVSDAGTPLISDPGQRLVESVTAQGHPVFPIPGASAALAALTASGLAGDKFLFAGFLPSHGPERRRAIREVETVPATLVFFEGPSRLAESLADLAALLGDRPAAVARELTKLHEEIRRAPLTDLAAHYAQHGDVKGEIVIVVAPPTANAGAVAIDKLDQQLAEALKRHPVKDAAAIVAAALGLPRREVYARALELKKQDA